MGKNKKHDHDKKASKNKKENIKPCLEKGTVYTPINLNQKKNINL